VVDSEEEEGLDKVEVNSEGSEEQMAMQCKGAGNADSKGDKDSESNLQLLKPVVFAFEFYLDPREGILYHERFFLLAFWLFSSRLNIAVSILKSLWIRVYKMKRNFFSSCIHLFCSICTSVMDPDTQN
jgi:hypothetical protein